MARNFQIASAWESDTISVGDEPILKDFITGLVGYPCKIACASNDGCVDIYVFSEKKKKVTDWIEIQASGAVGVIYDLYKKGDSTDTLDDACETYNEKNGFAFADDSDSDEISKGGEEDGEEGEGEGEGEGEEEEK